MVAHLYYSDLVAEFNEEVSGYARLSFSANVEEYKFSNDVQLAFVM
jgi:hypothetical protein